MKASILEGIPYIKSKRSIYVLLEFVRKIAKEGNEILIINTLEERIKTFLEMKIV